MSGSIYPGERGFGEQTFGKVSHGRETGLVQGDSHRAEMGWTCGHHRAAHVGDTVQRWCFLACCALGELGACSGEARLGGPLATAPKRLTALEGASRG